METKPRILLPALLLLATACASRVEPVREESARVGYASWYGEEFHGRKTASGEPYDMHRLTAAHRTAPFGTTVRVVHLGNGRSVEVRINDRGPFVRGRIIDLSLAAAQAIGLIEEGTAKVRLDFLGKAPSETRLFVQAGSFRERANAERSVRDLSRRHPDRPVRIDRGDGFYRVRLGPLDGEGEAARLIEALAEEGVEAFVLRQ